MSDPEAASGDAPEDHQPRGTLAVLMAFLLLIVVLWSFTFFLLMDRG